jgi:hypothetical protein
MGIRSLLGVTQIRFRRIFRREDSQLRFGRDVREPLACDGLRSEKPPTMLIARSTTDSSSALSGECILCFPSRISRGQKWMYCVSFQTIDNLSHIPFVATDGYDAHIHMHSVSTLRGEQRFTANQKDTSSSGDRSETCGVKNTGRRLSIHLPKQS